MLKRLDAGSIIVMAVTLALFVAALFVKGLTHDLFLEAGIFLVSVKIIMMSYRNHVTMERIEAKLDALLEAEKRMEAHHDGRSHQLVNEPPPKVQNQSNSTAV